jgi:predicted transcriptional regulator
MATTKKPYGFRLSDQAVKNLDEIHAITGMTNTAIVEFALAQMRATLKDGVERLAEIYNRHVYRDS